MITSLFTIATLIGVFVGPTGIVVGADTAVSDKTTGFVQMAHKYCQIGDSAVAMIQGQYGLTSTSGQKVPLYNAFRTTCDAIRENHTSLKQKAAELADELKAQLSALGDSVLDKKIAQNTPNHTIVSVVVAGYENSQALVLLEDIEARLTGPTHRWVITRRETHIDGRCQGWFTGEYAVVKALRNDSNFPPINRRKADVALLVSNDAGCPGWNYEAVKAAFKTAVNLTIQFGPVYGIQKGSVAPPLDMLFISSTDFRTEPIDALDR
jgi:hypothetical protein